MIYMYYDKNDKLVSFKQNKLNIIKLKIIYHNTKQILLFSFLLYIYRKYI